MIVIIVNRLHELKPDQTTARLARVLSLIGTETLTVRNLTRSARGTVEAPGRAEQTTAWYRELLERLGATTTPTP